MKLSIVIPVYNVEEYLSKCLDSVLVQGLRSEDYEIIIINDGSTDNSLEIAWHYAKNHDIIKIIDKENGGLSSARNCGIDCAKGKYIYFLDSDDYLIPNSLQILIDTCDQNNLDILTFISKSFSTSPSSDELVFKKTNLNFHFSDNLLSPIVDGENYVATRNYRSEAWSYILNNDFLQKSSLRFVEGRYLEDIIFSLELILRSKRIAHINIDIHRYRISSGSIMGSKNPDHYHKIIRDMQFAAICFTPIIERLKKDNAHTDCIARIKARQQSLVCFLMIRMLKSTIRFDELRQRMEELIKANAYPLDSFIGKDFYGFKYKIIVKLFKTKRRFYFLFHLVNPILRFINRLLNPLQTLIKTLII